MDGIHDGRGWWICGPAKYTLPALPRGTDPGLGFVYGLEFSSGMVKIGKSRNPARRIQLLGGILRDYADTRIVAVGLSHPMAQSAEMEKYLHGYFATNRGGGEIFSCSLAEVAAAIAGSEYRQRPEWLGRRGRRPEPHYYESRKAWYVKMGGRQILLGRNEATARAKFREIEAGTA